VEIQKLKDQDSAHSTRQDSMSVSERLQSNSRNSPGLSTVKNHRPDVGFESSGGKKRTLISLVESDDENTALPPRKTRRLDTPVRPTLFNAGAEYDAHDVRLSIEADLDVDDLVTISSETFYRSDSSLSALPTIPLPTRNLRCNHYHLNRPSKRTLAQHPPQCHPTSQTHSSCSLT
jgi:hypothetical protein